MRVFVSYTTKDPAISVDKLRKVEALISSFAKVFIDLLHNQRGNQRRVERELGRCDVFLHLSSPGYESDWVEKELIMARKKGKPVIKVGIDELLKMCQEDAYLMISDIDRRRLPVWLICVIAGVICVGVSLLGIYFSYNYVDAYLATDENLHNARGLFGDSWGGVNAIISAFAFAGVIVTLYLQNTDLNLQRKEMARQREEFEKENTTLRYQRFENLFYNMLNLQQKIVEGLRYEYVYNHRIVSDKASNTERRVVMGRDVFRLLFETLGVELAGGVGFHARTVGYRTFLDTRGVGAYDTTWVPSHFDHYFRHLYKIIQFVDRQGFSFEEAYKYVSLLRGTLSRYELVWIYYNALSSDYYPFKNLIEKYSLLKNLRVDLLAQTMEAKMFLNAHGLNSHSLKKAGFSGNCFEFYLTDNVAEFERYHLSAFWKKEDINEGKVLLMKWRDFINNASEQGC